MKRATVVKGLNKLRRIIERPESRRVKRVNLAVTYMCDSRCLTCNIWKRYRREPGLASRELTVGEYERLFESSCLRSVDEVLITGGEPFLRRDLPSLYGRLAARLPAAAFVVSTNGLRRERIIAHLGEMMTGAGAESPPAVVFSLDGLGPAHDRVRGVAGGFERTVGTMKEVARRFKDIRLAVSFTITRDNYRELRSVHALASELGAGFTMRFFAESPGYYANEGTAAAWSEAELDEVDEAVREVTERMASQRNALVRLLNPDIYFFRRLVDYQRNPRRLHRCFSGTHSFFLDPAGHVYPCIFLDRPMGNIRERPFDELWLDRAAVQTRRFIESGQCHCWSECEVLPSLQRRLFGRGGALND
ncbi:MAG TPA: radical SAM protein [Deltaproteobacteria bacterium]|nr:radical SAM protein [Deltaproteobacteria bacterium]